MTKLPPAKKLKPKRKLLCEYPHLVEEWHPTKNGKRKPKEFSYGSTKKMWWKCLACQHEWMARVNNRTSGRGCSQCSRVNESNKLSKFGSPRILKEWMVEKNLPLTIDKVAKTSKKKVWWKCLNCKHEWKTRINDRFVGKGCPACANKVTTTENCFKSNATKKLLDEWDIEKNLPLRPMDVVGGSTKKVWWKCQTCFFSWETQVRYRSKDGRGCPKCRFSKMEKKVEEYLSEFHPELSVKPQEIITYNRSSERTYTDFTITFEGGERLIIETDGIQHFIQNTYYNRKQGFDALEKLVKRDKKQDAYCLKRGDHVLRIPYSVKLDEFPGHLEKAIKRRKIQNEPTLIHVHPKVYTERDLKFEIRKL